MTPVARIHTNSVLFPQPIESGILMRNLKIQLLFSHLLLVGLMVVVMAGAVVKFYRLGGSIDRILKDNYASVIAAQDMKETLERQDSAATFFLAGNAAEARTQYEENRQKFEQAYLSEARNITETGEQQVADAIRDQFAAYTGQMRQLLNSEPPTSKARADEYSRVYFATLKPAFLRLKNRAQEILNINQEAIQRADARAKTEARQAAWTGIGVATGATGLALLFALRMIRASLTPLRSLARQAEEIGAGRWNQRIELRRTDEIGALADSFNRMAAKLREAWALEEQRLHRAERMSDAALESLYDPVIVTDSKGAVIHWNRAAARLFGPEEKALGLPIAQIVSEKRIVDAVENAIHQERVSAAEGEAGFVSLLADAVERTYRLRATPMRDEENTLLGAVAVLEDITHLRELDRLKTEFISVASHELRTPVTSLLLSAQLLEEGAAGELNSDQKEILGTQREDLSRLERMMRDLLDITRLEAGVMPSHFEPTIPEELIAAAVHALAGQAEAKGVSLTFEAPENLPLVRADKGQVTRVLINLIGNAVRHTPKGGKVTARARLDGAKVNFQVQDNGAGIPREYLTRIFERFAQVPGATGGGAGMGLAIAQNIVKAHGGLITAESEPGMITIFTFSLQTTEGRC